MSYYKFAAKMIGSGKRIMDVGCNEGFGTFLLAKECGYVQGIDFDEEAVEVAKKNFASEQAEFVHTDFFEYEPKEKYNAITSFDVIEHIIPEHATQFLGKIASSLKENGIAVIGTPSKPSQQYTSDVAKLGHINIYDHERLEEELYKHFSHVFLFAANDEMVHTGFMPFAHYYIAVACGPKC
ncbi:MAG: class I SAM-dependent methyltransferase [Chlamydiae bacterium]|nr:class I SAM-dependent methyltransferase [Chlamydiota bacterium]